VAELESNLRSRPFLRHLAQTETSGSHSTLSLSTVIAGLTEAHPRFPCISISPFQVNSVTVKCFLFPRSVFIYRGERWPWTIPSCGVRRMFGRVKERWMDTGLG
jgi:hypothetical protein